MQGRIFSLFLFLLTFHIAYSFLIKDALAAELAVIPQHDSASVGDTVAVDIFISDIANLYGCGFDLTYDPWMVSYVGASEGTFMSEEGAVPTIFVVTADSADGLVLAGLTRSQYVSGGISTATPANLMTLLFQVRAPDSSRLMFARSSLIAPDGVTKIEHEVTDGWIRGFLATSVGKDEEELGKLPEEFRLFAPYPNPFNGSTTLQCVVGRRQEVQVTIYDCLGRITTCLFDGVLPAGEYSFEWDGRAGEVGKAATGIYYFSVRGKTYKEARKVIFLK